MSDEKDYQQSEPPPQQTAPNQPKGLLYIGSGEDFPTDVHCSDCC